MAGRIALLQLDATVGDLDGNSRRIEQFTKQANDLGADIAVTTELAICGYPPRDLLLQDEFIFKAQETAGKIPSDIPLLVGSPITAESTRKLPANGVVRAGPIEAKPAGDLTRVVAKKQLLPTYDVFDEARYFQADSRSGITRTMKGLDIGVTICEDAWQAAGHTPSEYAADPIEHLAEWGRQGVELAATVNLSASPYHADKMSTRIEVARVAAKVLSHPFLLANQVGGNDDLLFDGRSLVAWPNGNVTVAPAWKEGILLVDLEQKSASWHDFASEDAVAIGQDEMLTFDSSQDGSESEGDLREELCDAVVSGLADYCRKSKISSIVLGLSGGIDSAVAACVAAAAVGPENVTGIAMPSRHSSQHSIDDAQYTAEALGINYELIGIDEMHKSAEATIGEKLSGGHAVASENLQARLRGLIVMGHANAFSAMAIATGNKSELAQGYCTLYGDMAGGYCPLGDLYKMEVYALGEVFNARAIAAGLPAPVSDSTMTKPPSAELAPDQKDEDSLPPYPVLDAILKAHIEDGLDTAQISELGFERDIVLDVLTRLERNEHKRWQMAPAPRVSKKAFGQGWRRPLASRHDWRHQ